MHLPIITLFCKRSIKENENLVSVLSDLANGEEAHIGAWGWVEPIVYSSSFCILETSTIFKHFRQVFSFGAPLTKCEIFDIETRTTSKKPYFYIQYTLDPSLFKVPFIDATELRKLLPFMKDHGVHTVPKTMTEIFDSSKSVNEVVFHY